MNKLWAAVMAVGTLVGCTSEQPDIAETNQTHHPIVAGAGYTTFDAIELGCLNGANPGGINCNAYAAKDKVFMSGGPNHPTNGLSNGTYFFAVLTPGSQLAAFLDGNLGNLSDATAGGTTGDSGSGDPVANRTFVVEGHEIVSYAGTHQIGMTPNGRFAIGLAPFDDTDNAGGVYILAICATDATDPAQCKYDAFRIRPASPDEPLPQFPIVHGGKYYDADLDGHWDVDSEPGIPNWLVDYHDMISGTVETGPDGQFTLELIPDGYLFIERQPTNAVGALPVWFQTGNTIDQTTVEGGAYANLNADKTYWIEVDDDQVVRGLYFGNICIGAGGGHTIGFWSNKNGQKRIDAGDLAALVALHLRDGNGAPFDPTSAKAYRTWVLSATATNMAYMLSAQLSAAVLNLRNDLVSPYATIYAPGTTSADALGFARLTDVIAEANESLAGFGVVLSDNPERAHQEALATALDHANNNLSFVQTSPATCPTALF